MNMQTKIEPFDALAAYEREREENRRLFDLIGKVLFVADDLIAKVERGGEDVTVKKAILEQARRERLA